jgi:hypothetical protein
MTKADFPWCTIFIVVGAIICHILVLIGNLQTAKTLRVIGASSSGWSEVGTSLGGSLHGELDHLIHETVTKLTDALDAIIKVESDIDYALSAVANVTDGALATFHKISSQSLAATDASLQDGEVASLLQSRVSVCEDRCDAPSDELTSLLQGKVKMNLAASDSENEQDDKDQKQEQTPHGSKTLAAVRSTLHTHVRQMVEKVEASVQSLFEIMKPALLQIGKWLRSMGPKMQGVIEEVGIVIDHVQKLIDDVMARIAGPARHSELMLHHAFALFDVDESEDVSTGDMHKASILYGITALQSTKGEQLLAKYDANHDDTLSKDEFSLLVRDDSIPKAPTVMLRTYARKLAEVAGTVKAARHRDEVAHAVVQYLTLVSTKNRTKTRAVAKELTQGSLPLGFVADVLKQLAHNFDNPGIPAVVSVGPVIIREMVKLNAGVVSKALKVMADAKWWHESGFDPSEQPKLVKRASKWVAEAGGEAVAPQLLQVFVNHVSNGAGSISSESLAMLASDSVQRSSKRFAARQRALRVSELETLMSSETSVALFQTLLGSSASTRGVILGVGVDLDVARVVRAGEIARPETLQFAESLAQDANKTAKELQQLCFDHSHSSSNTVDSLANQIQGMLMKTQNFLRLMQRYSTPQGIQTLEDRINKFVRHGADEVVGIIDKKINATLEKIGSHMHHATLIEEDWTVDEVEGLWKDVIKFTRDLKSMLPTVIDDMKFARREVSRISSNMMTLFPVLQEKSPPVFAHAGNLYAALWITYFVIFILISLCLLYYGFWASGYLGGPAAESGEPEVSSSLQGRCLICCRACLGCFDRCPDSTLCYWSAMITACTVVLIMYIMSTALALLCAIQAWIGVGCDEFYLLSDNTICVEVMQGIQSWLQSFWKEQQFATPMESICQSKALLTCQAVSFKLRQPAILTTGSSLLATVFTCQMIFDSARLHEQARWRRAIEEKTLEVSEKD